MKLKSYAESRRLPVPRVKEYCLRLFDFIPSPNFNSEQIEALDNFLATSVEPDYPLPVITVQQITSDNPEQHEKLANHLESKIELRNKELYLHFAQSVFGLKSQISEVMQELEGFYCSEVGNTYKRAAKNLEAVLQEFRVTPAKLKPTAPNIQDESDFFLALDLLLLEDLY